MRDPRLFEQAIRRVVIAEEDGVPQQQIEQRTRRLIVLEPLLLADDVEFRVGQLEEPFEVITPERVESLNRVGLGAWRIVYEPALELPFAEIEKVLQKIGRRPAVAQVFQQVAETVLIAGILQPRKELARPPGI